MRCKSHSSSFLNPLTLIWDGGSPATDTAGLSRLWAAAGQRDGLDVLGEAGGLGQTDHGEAVEGWAVGTVTDYLSDINVLLGAFIHSHVMFPERCNGAVRSAGTEEERLLFIKLRQTFQASGRNRPMTLEQ